MIELSNLNYWMWFGFAIFLTIIEVMVGGSFFLLWVALSALLVGLIKWLVIDFSWQYQILTFSTISVACIFIWHSYLKKRPIKMEHQMLNQKAKQFIGKYYFLYEPIVNGIGKIRVGDSVWQVSGPDLSVGTRIEVLDMKGTILIVKQSD